MAQYDSAKIGYTLNIDGDYHNTLDIESFSLMMKNPSSCYKFYWLEALVVLISEGVTKTTFDVVIDEMIANAWYSVREFHIHLSGMVEGEVRDGLERAILTLTELSRLPANASKTQIKNAIRDYNPKLKNFKERLTHMVPYRALAGFFDRSEEVVNWGSTVWMVKYIQQFSSSVTPLPYTLGSSSQLKKEIFFNPAWIRMIQDNTVSIMGWIQYDVDHFVPWSFVMNDELWKF